MSRLISRDAARALGLTRFFIGTRCRHGHVAERRVSNGACIPCLRIACRRYQDATDYTARWRAAHPVETAAQGGANYARASARKHGLSSPVPPGYDLHLTHPIYAEAVKRRAKGQRVHVDHIIPIPLGGLHVAENLAVLTVEEHRAKTQREAPIVRAAAAYRRMQRSA